MSVRLQRAMELTPKFTGFLSFCGSSWIVYEVLCDPKKRRHVYHRILLMMSLFDCVTSFGWIMSSWPVNPERSPDTLYAVGNDITCNLQGFFWQLCYGTFLYNGFLSLYYLLLIRYNWSARKIARRIEPWYHGFVLLLSGGTAVAGLPLKLYNSLGQSCWIGAYPPDCKQSFQNGGVTDCERGDNATVYAWAFLIVWVWLSIVFSTGAMFLMYLSVWEQERRNERYSFLRRNNLSNASFTGRFAAGASFLRSSRLPQQTQQQGARLSQSGSFRRWKQKKSTHVAKSCLLYLGALCIVWIGSLTFELWRAINPNVPFGGVNVFMVATLPLQGSMNFVVYMRPRYLDYRKRNPDAPMFVLMKLSLIKSFYRRRSRQGGDDSDDDDCEILSEVPNNFNDEDDTSLVEGRSEEKNNNIHVAMPDESERRFGSEEEAGPGRTGGGRREASMFADNPTTSATAAALAAARHFAQVDPNDEEAAMTNKEQHAMKQSADEQGLPTVDSARRERAAGRGTPPDPTE